MTTGSESPSRTALRASFVTEQAPALAATVCERATQWSSAMRLSTQFGWFSDGDCLVVVGCPGEPQRDLDLGLAFGLAHAGNRELVLVLPDGAEEPTRRRLPWIDPPVTLHTFDRSGIVRRAFALARAEVLAATDDPLVTSVHDLENREPWIERLMRWANACPELVEAHRSSYLAWHCRGRMALRARKVAGGLSITAGIHSSAPGQSPHEERLTGPLSAEQFHRLVSAASAAMADRLGGIDAANAEHQLQERLAAMRGELRLVRTMREFPAMRPVGNRGFIDLLGVGSDGAIHVIETKIGADSMLVLQGLDYWIWAMAHREELAAHVGNELEVTLAKSPPIVLDFVVGEAKGAFVSPYTAAQAEALDGSIAWRFHAIEGWEGENPAITSLGRRCSPEGPRAADAKYASSLEIDLIARAGAPLRRRVFFAETGGGILVSARPGFDALQERGLLHGFVDHVRSSQAFALNLFGGLSDVDIRHIWSLIDPAVVSTGGIEFEYIDPSDALGELQPERPHQTQVDVLLRGTSRDGKRCVTLVEVKLSETEFGACSAFDSARNNRRDVCRSAGPWGRDPTACFQLRNHDGPTRRRYDEYLRTAWVSSATPECPFRELNQPMRNVALARALIDRGEADFAVFALCAPLDNVHVWRQWRRAEPLFLAVPGVSLRPLPAEHVLAVVDADRRNEIQARYGLVAEEP
jgi:hypothetical protein